METVKIKIENAELKIKKEDNTICDTVADIDKKDIEPAKSSNEILAELFKVFNADLPKDIEDELEKKPKHTKSKEPEKKSKHKSKKHKKDGEKNKTKKRKIIYADVTSKSADLDCEPAKKKNSKSNHDIEQSVKLKLDKFDFYTGADYHSHDKKSKEKYQKSLDDDLSDRKSHKKHEQTPDNKSSRDSRHTRHNDDLKEKNYKKYESKCSDLTQDNWRLHEDKYTRRDADEVSIEKTTHDFWRVRDSKHTRHEDVEVTNEKTHKKYEAKSTDSRRLHDSRHLRHDRRRSPMHDLVIDKKRLLETARKNAISMLRNGTLPGCSHMTDEVKDKIINKIRYSGKTVKELTEFCKKLTNDAEFDDLSSSDDSDIDRTGKVKPFTTTKLHHPFQLQEREAICVKLNSGSHAEPVKVDEKKTLTALFPVSSGQHHRLNEAWVPVETKPAAPLPLMNLQNHANKTKVLKNIFEKTIPLDQQQDIAFRCTETNKPLVNNDNSNLTLTAQDDTSQLVVAIIPTKPSTLPEIATNTVQEAQLPITATNTCTETNNAMPMAQIPDVSAIISNRLNAMRRLQSNPMDSEAVKLLYNSHKDMSCWAAGNQSATQLHDNTNLSNLCGQPRQNSLTVPLSGGMGMYLLQKMGWRPGEGLGRERNGALEPLVLDVKNDKRGLVAKEDQVNAKTVLRQNVHKKQRKNSNMPDLTNKHPVCILNELAAQRRWTPPFYDLVNEDGPSHSKMFLFSVSINGQIFTPAKWSNNKKEAKLFAARHCLEQLNILPYQ